MHSERIKLMWRKGIVFSCLAPADTVVSQAQDQAPSPNTVTFTALVNFTGNNGAYPNGVATFSRNVYCSLGQAPTRWRREAHDDRHDGRAEHMHYAFPLSACRNALCLW